MNYLKISLLSMLCIALWGSKQPDTRVHKVFIYEKSNFDGSNKGKIAVYYSSPDQIESFKWHEGNNHATLVKAKMDLKNHTVERFEVAGVDHEGNENPRGVLEVLEGQIAHIRLGDNYQVFDSVPAAWHSYDFDFASLGHAYPSFSRNKSSTFHILDLDLADSPPKFKDFGTVEMEYVGEEEKWDRTVLKYHIDGAGLDHRGGHIWFDKAGSFLVGFEIDKPDEPGYTSNKLVLVDVLDKTPEQWAAFKVEKLN